MDLRRIRHRISNISKTVSRPRVFIAAHPDDQAGHLERVIRMLEDQQECIIYYYEHADGEAEKATRKELSQALDDMQLIVAVVTVKLLNHPSLAMDDIIPYATDHNIPVLPLLMEPDAAKQFSRKFGDLQYLIPDDPDRTAEPFEKKLETYLSDVLVSPETAQRIRDAFDACIFLSYRKKDRTFARELMKMIHRNPRYRDISFWYDEFLVPGEDFNDGISKALEDSDLFTMVVTPNLLEDPNYVMSHEYPAARDAGKTIFPVEMDSTDKKAMEKAYKGLPRCVTAREDGEWEEELEEKLKKFCVRTGADDPQHLFLIGLAYLDGINMEVDTDKAVRLITEAAEAGLEEAMRKLSLMYLYGKGVSKSLQTSTDWQEKLRDSIQHRFYAEQTDEVLEELYKEQNFLANRYYKLRDDVRTAGSAYTLIDFAEQKVRRGLPGAKHDLAFCTTKAGTIAMQLDVYGMAKDAFVDAIKMYNEVIDEEPDDRYRSELSSTYNFLGNLYSSRNMYPEALECYEKCKEQLLKIEDEAYSTTVLSKLTSSCANQASILISSDRRDEALEILLEAEREAEKIPMEKATDDYRRALDFLYFELGEMFYDTEGDRGKTLEYRRKRIRLLELRIEDAKESGRRYARLYIDMGRLYRYIRDFDEAGKYFLMSLDIPEEDPEIPDVYADHMDAYAELKDLARLEPEKYEEYYNEELRIARYLADKTEAPEYYDRVASLLENHDENDIDALEEALQFRQLMFMKVKIFDSERKRDVLRNRLYYKYKDHPELKRYRIAMYETPGEEISKIKDDLVNADFKVYDLGGIGYSLRELVRDIEPDMVLIDAENDSWFRTYESAKERVDENTSLIERSKSPPVLLITDKAQKRRLKKGVKEGVYDIITRPFTSEAFIKKVREVTGITDG